MNKKLNKWPLEEKCFDAWKNDFSQEKAWGKNRIATEKALRKQDQRRQKKDASQHALLV